MELKEQVTNLELSKKLKKLGVKQESYFWWSKPVDDFGEPKGSYFVTGDPCRNCDHKLISAFTASELGEMLPVNMVSFFKRENPDEWICNLHYLSECTDENGDYEHYGYQTADISEANSRARMLVYLLENKLINL